MLKNRVVILQEAVLFALKRYENKNLILINLNNQI